MYFEGDGDGHSLVTADFNGDGNPDLGWMTWSGLSLLLGNGDGTFRPLPKQEVGFGVGPLAVADFDGDGVTDLAAFKLCNGSHICSFVLRGHLDGRFEVRPETDVGDQHRLTVGGPLCAAGDVDGDGRPDVVANSDLSSVLVLRNPGNDGAWPFSTWPAGGKIIDAKLADLDGDGMADVIAGGDNGLSLLMGRRDGGLSAPIHTRLPDVVAGVATGDFDGDQVVDVVAAARTLKMLLFRSGADPGGAWQPASPAIDHTYFGEYAVADFDRDGNLDLAGDGWDSEHISVILGGRRGSFEAPLEVPMSALRPGNYNLVTADFNRDGKPDIASLFGDGVTGGIFALINTSAP